MDENKKHKKLQKKKSLNNIWNKNDFRMYAMGKFKPLEYIKYFVRCLRYSKQRITRGFADIDVWELHSYLSTLIPEMLQSFRDNHFGAPSRLGEECVNEEGIMVNDACHERWDEILDRMIFLWRESGENTCTRVNTFEAEYDKAYEEFKEKYGLWGEGLCTPEEIAECNETGYRTMHFMREVPEYEDICDKYSEENKQIDEYRSRCKDEAIDMLKEYFYDLWD